MKASLNKNPLKCLVTGFGPFPGFKVNPSELLVKKLNQLQPDEFENFETLAEVLPTEWKASLQCLGLLHEKFKPDIMIHFGVSSEAFGFQFEQCANNGFSTKLDAAGLRYSPDMNASRDEDRIFTRIDIKALIDKLNHNYGCPAYFSNDPGNYICNSLYYHSLKLSDRPEGPESVLFVHVPPLTDGVEQSGTQLNNGFTLERLTAGAIKIVATVMEQFETEKNERAIII